MIKKVASDEGYNVLTSDNGYDGWKKIQENAVDLLFCDFNIPNKEFINLANTIRSNPTTKDLTIVMILPYSDHNTVTLAKQIQAKAWIKKPIEENKLKLILTKIFTKNS